jgi:hypothetical protein
MDLSPKYNQVKNKPNFNIHRMRKDDDTSGKSSAHLTHYDPSFHYKY